MIIKLKVFFLTLLTFLLLAAPQSAFAIDCSKFSSDPDIISGKTLGVYHLECVYQKFIGVVAPLAGLVAFIFIAYGGIIKRRLPLPKLLSPFLYLAWQWS